MGKVLLVEDDQNLREIFEMRLKAEGYDTVVAGDGEEALTVAVKEKPDLIIADIMMPKLSGFEMLETLRASPDIANTKVVMMTALGQAEDQARGEKLGVVKYLVKSQVTLEDFVRVVHDVLQPDQKTSPAQNSLINNNQESESPMPDDSNAPINPVPDANPISGAPAVPDAPAADDGQMSTAQEQSAVDSQINDFAAAPTAPAADPMAAPAVSDPMAAPADGGSVPVTPPPAADPVAPAADAGAAPAADPTVPTDGTSTGL